MDSADHFQWYLFLPCGIARISGLSGISYTLRPLGRAESCRRGSVNRPTRLSLPLPALGAMLNQTKGQTWVRGRASAVAL